MTAPSGSSHSNVSVWELADDWLEVRGLEVQDIRTLISDRGKHVWIDIDGTRETPAAALAQVVRDCDELEGLDPVRAGQGGENPPKRPPKAKSFHNFIFGRVYWLEQKESEDQVEVIAQEIHMIAGETFAITIRYPCLPWPLEEMPSATTEDGGQANGGGIELEQLREEVRTFVSNTADRGQSFGLKFAGILLDQVVDSVFDTLNDLREVADRLERKVLHKEEWLWHPRSWPELDSKMSGMRRFLRQVRWAFMPPDEISEFCSGPFLGIPERDPRIDFLFKDLGREAERALATVKDVTEQVEQIVAMRDTLKTDRLNRTIYVLTIVATVLLVPTLIAGVYGMNFEKMPELRWRFGYLGTVIAMVLVSTGVWVGIRWYLRRT